MKIITIVKSRNRVRLSSVAIYYAMLFLTMSASVCGQRNYLFENISVTEGISNSEVHSILQDRDGFLWISTADGLNRYDGNVMTVFKNDPNDSTTIADNNCFAIAEDPEGFIWIGISGNAITRYDPKNESFKSYPIATGSVTNISEYYTALADSKGNLWFGSTNHGMQKYNRSKDSFEQVTLDSANANTHWGQIFGIIELTDGSILASDYSGGIKIYNKKLNVFEPFSLKTNYSLVEINLIYEDASGNIWFGGRDQLIRYSPTNYTTEYYDVFSLIIKPTNFDNITGIIQDNEGYVWAGLYSQGLYRIDPKTKNIRKFEFYSDNSNISARIIINAIYKDKYDVIWISTWGKGLTKFDPLREPFNYSKFNYDELSASNAGDVTTIIGSKQYKEITIGTSAMGLYLYDLESKKSSHLKIKFDPSTIPDGNVNIQGLASDNDGNTWISYNNLGLYKIDRNNSLHFIRSPHKKKNSVYYTNSLKIDLSGNVWIASVHGFEKYSPARHKFTLLPTIMNKKMSENLWQKIHRIPQTRDPISAILKVGEASTSEKKFSLEQDQKVLIICVGEGVMTQGNAGVRDRGSLLAEDGKLIWTMNDLSKTYNDGGGFKNRIAIKSMNLKKGDYKITFATDVGHSYGTWNTTAPPDSLWYGIQVLPIDESEFTSLSELNKKEINSDKYMPMEIGTCIEFSRKLDNILWLGSQRNSFFKYDLASGNYKQYNFDIKSKFSPKNAITFIFEDSEGIVWIATQNSLLRFDPETERINTYDQKDGLPSNQINSIIEDLLGNLWISTSGGLSKLNKNAPQDRWNFVNFDARDGLQSYSSSNASWISPDGEIVLGGNDGVTSFFPGKINEAKPDVVITDIKVSEVSVKSDSSAIKLERSITRTDELNLSFTQNNLSFEFSSIHFSRPEKNKINYRMEGFNNNWISTDRNFASFTNLAPGNYTFRIKGSNGDGIWNDEGKSIRINISPPWWKTWVAYSIYGLLFIAVVFGIDRLQRRRLLQAQIEKTRKLELAQAKEIEKAYTELKATQVQLIQSEKMASLGELTAGIAHEIQNPLNFVNNFSDVSSELLAELDEEIEKDNQDEVKSIAIDLRQNLDKIHHHGQRASSIVKGMLEHSRTNHGNKEPTDINAMADEYIRLAYHGIRAKNKSFHADFKADLDENVPKIKVVGQDIARVVLNLINNAFYAVSAKASTTNESDYKPLVIVSTKMMDRNVEIRVQDNGDGIPENIIEKIFQPFFTTKASGEGTGLGLSLSYDIITKGHGGDIKVNTKEGVGTEFIITLPNN